MIASSAATVERADELPFEAREACEGSGFSFDGKGKEGKTHLVPSIRPSRYHQPRPRDRYPAILPKCLQQRLHPFRLNILAVPRVRPTALRSIRREVNHPRHGRNDRRRRRMTLLLRPPELRVAQRRRGRRYVGRCRTALVEDLLQQHRIPHVSLNDPELARLAEVLDAPFRR